MKLSKLAFENVKKSYKDYFIYFLTLMFSVCLFYTFNSFSSQKNIMELSESQAMSLQMVGLFMNMLSFFVVFVLAFLILYANNFLIRRRKKEFGIYMMLGMEKRDISKILIYETLFVGSLSLITGLILGIGCSQILGIVTAKGFGITVDYHIIFSFGAMLATILSFSAIFFILMLLNTRVIAKVKLIDLLQAKKKVEKIRINNPFVAVILLIISLICSGIAYWLTTYSLESFALSLAQIMLLGSIGTILFFVSLSGFLLQFMKLSKKVYYKKLNIYVLRQINAKINTTSISMGVVCLMLLLSIGALSCGLSLNASITKVYEQASAYPFTYHQNEPISEEDMKNLLILSDVDYYNTVTIYKDEHTINDILPYIDSRDAKDKMYRDAKVEYISLSDYNEAMRSQGKETMMLKDNEGFFISGFDEILSYLNEAGDKHIDYQLFGHDLKISNKKEDITILGTNFSPDVIVTMVVPDQVLAGQTSQVRYWNIEVDDAKLQPYIEKIEKNMYTYADEHKIEHYRFSGTSQKEVEDNVMGIGMLFTYIGLYLGIVFMISSAAILALQQLSEAEDSRANYEILRKIGTPEKMMNRSVLLQIGIYFLLPMGLAIIHSFIGVPAVSGAFGYMFGVSSMWKSNLMTGAIIVAIYGIYFIVTYHGYKTTLRRK